MFASAAQKYISCGLSVFPATSTKKPAIPSWTPYQTRLPSAEELESWAKDLDNMNVAIVCGKFSDLTVVDCDTPEAVAKIEALLPDLLEVPIVETPRGGRHYYFYYCPELHSRNGAQDGIDVKSEGGYVLAPPSRTKDGSYVWPKNLKPGLMRERPILPDALRAFLAAAITQPAPAAPNKPILTQGTRDNDLFHVALQLFRDDRPRDEVERVIINMAKVCAPPFSEKEARAKVESAWKRIRAKAPEKDEDEAASLAERDASMVRVRPISYLWPDVVPFQMNTSITGDAGIGKSLVCVDMAARTTRGRAFPVYGQPSPPVKGHIFYITSEGVPEMILVPRLIAAGADLGKITIIEGIYQKNGEFSMFDVTRHLRMISRRAKDFPDLKLTIIDPIASFIPERINTNQQNQVRQTMDRISEIAYKLEIAAITTMHFSKTPGVKAAHRTAGSAQFGAAVKMSWAVVRREDDPRNLRLLVPQKSNITGNHRSISFAIQEVKFPAPDDPKTIITTAKIEYGRLVDEDPEMLISPPIENDGNVSSAIRFLTDKLRESNHLCAGPLITEAETRGLPKWALYKAKDRLGVEHDKEGQFQGRTYWFLPEEKRLCL